MSPISSHPDLDQIEDNEAKRSLLNSAIFWGTSGAIFGIHDEPDKYGSVNYLHPIDGTHAKYWFGFTRIDSFKIKSYLKTRFPFMFEEFCDNYLRHSVDIQSKDVGHIGNNLLLWYSEPRWFGDHIPRLTPYGVQHEHKPSRSKFWYQTSIDFWSPLKKILLFFLGYIIPNWWLVEICHECLCLFMQRCLGNYLKSILRPTSTREIKPCGKRYVSKTSLQNH